MVSTGSTDDPGSTGELPRRSTGDPVTDRTGSGLDRQPIHGAGFTATPLTITVMWVWQPVDQPVVPISPTTWPRETAWPTWVR